ncbi:MAG: hypothetical protein LBQ28_09045 [Prevotellaceae bacterium]|jgi:hypothetical protein|nr:hypothetical protein [Prevotellaceae bacterium]
MHRRLLAILCLSFFGFSVFAQNLSNDYKVIHVGKQVKDIAYKNPCASPLENYVARMHLWIEGNYDTIYSGMIDAVVRQQSHTPYPQKAAELLLNSNIEQEVIYKDSVGIVFRKETNSDSYFVGLSVFENGKWLGSGEDLCFVNNMNETKQYIENNSVAALNKLRRLEQVKVVSTDTSAFVNYLEANGKEPISYLINKLKYNKLVIYGEIHFRKNSWELLRHLIKMPDFSKTTGTVFLELSMSAQTELDKFFNNKAKDANIILDIFRKEEITGWADKGMFDFLMDLWDINHNLSNENKIKIIATDYQRPFYNEIISKKQYDSISAIHLDRNEIMAKIVENQINKSNDRRNNLFIVGCGHAYKSSALQRGRLQINGLSAGNILSEKLENENVFSIFTHSARITNNGYILGKIRKGLYDFVFAENGNKPIAFDLKNSPFCNEPFDNADIGFDIKTGTFADNFDGYIFLQPLQQELRNTPLYQLYTDDYINEIKRRAKIINAENDIFWGIELKNLNCKELFEKLKTEKDKKRWGNL